MALTPPAPANSPAHLPAQDAELPEDIDRIAVVVDWLDACRTRDLNMLLDLYAEEARLECKCDGTKIHSGRTELDSYWRPRLDGPAAVAFDLDAIAPVADGVMLDYRSHEGKPVRIHFSFDRAGKIVQTRCEPTGPVS